MPHHWLNFSQRPSGCDIEVYRWFEGRPFVAIAEPVVRHYLNFFSKPGPGKAVVVTALFRRIQTAWMTIMNEAQKILIDNAHEAFAELMDCYFGPESEICDQPISCGQTESPEGHVATLGFGDDDLQGAVTILSDATEATQLGGPEGVEMGDWLGELCNQLAGRVKNRLCGYGRMVALGLPTQMSGNHLKIPTRGETREWRLTAGKISLKCYFSSHVDEDLQLELAEDSAVHAEGSCSMFF